MMDIIEKIEISQHDKLNTNLYQLPAIIVAHKFDLNFYGSEKSELQHASDSLW